MIETAARITSAVGKADLMYQRTAELYDLMNEVRGKDYAIESATVTNIIRERNPTATTLLDVACGTGGHLVHFRGDFDVVGIDLSEEMLDVARQRVPDVDVRRADMRTLDLGRRFDAVVTLFSAVGYLLSDADLDAALGAMANHLEPGGVLVVEPWFHPDAWIDGFVLAEAANTGDLAVARVSHSTVDGTTSRFDFHYSIARPEGVESFVEPHELRLRTAEEYRAGLERAGLVVEHDPEGLIGRGLFIGLRPT